MGHRIHLIQRRLLIGTTLLATLLIVSAGSAVWAEPLAIGATLPKEARDFSLESPDDGISSSLGGLAAPGGLLVIFTANTCAYSVDWQDRIPVLAGLAEQHHIGFALINSNARKRKSDDSPAAMSELARRAFPGITYWIDRQSRLADLLGATRTPEVFLFDAEQRLVYQGVIDDHSGPISEVQRHLTRDALNALVSASPMPESTAPIGCAILRPRKRRAPNPD